MIFNPFRLFDRHEKLKAAALEEAHYLRRRHGREAVNVAMQKLVRPELTRWGRKVLMEAIRLLQSTVP